MSNEQTPPPGQELPSTFSQLVIMIATSALQQLGQIPDPSGAPPEVNLEGAQGMIDILETLETKTAGNLDDGEKKMLSESLTMLRMQYVEVAQTRKSGDATPPPPAAQPAPETAEQTAADEIQTPPAGGAEEPAENKTRFRKSYG